MAQYEPFNVFLRQLLKEAELKPRNLLALLEKAEKDTGRVYTIRTIERYLAGESCPDINSAQIICDVLNIKISKEELAGILNTTQLWNNAKKIALSAKYIDKHVMLNINDFQEKLGIEEGNEVVDIINKRIIELYGPKDKKGFGHYIRDLIIEDLINETLSNKEDMEEIGNGN